MRKLGWCAPFARAGAVKKAGYDYLEAPLAAFGLEIAASLAAAKAAIAGAPLPVPVFNWFYPQDLRVVGEDVDRPRIKTYLGRAAELLAHVRAETAVLGSAWSRNVPEGFSRARAETQILENYALVADAFAGSGVTIAIEAQNRKEANIITSLAEAVGYAAAVNRPEIRIMADLYHMEEAREPLSEVKAHAGWIAHVQLSDSRRHPPGAGGHDYAAFFRFLEEGGYKGAVSVECTSEIPEDQMRHSLEFLRLFWS